MSIVVGCSLGVWWGRSSRVLTILIGLLTYRHIIFVDLPNKENNSGEHLLPKRARILRIMEKITEKIANLPHDATYFSLEFFPPKTQMVLFTACFLVQH